MKIQSLIILLIVSLIKHGHAQFEVIETPATSSVYLACSPELCLIMDWETYFAKTDNIGNSFDTLNYPAGLGYAVNDIQYTSDSTFFLKVVNKDLFRTKVFKSTDNGEFWIEVIDTNFICQLFAMANDSIGALGGYPGRLITTNDGWQTTLSHSWGSVGFQKAFFLNDSVGFAGHSNGALKTLDSGVTWVTGFSSTGFSPKGFAALDQGTMLLTTQQNGAGGYKSAIYGSTDFGENWLKMYSTPQNIGERINSIACPTNEECIAVGRKGSENALLFRTLDRGETWYQIEIPVKAELYTIEFANDSIALLGGENGTLIRMNRNKLSPPPDTTDTTSSIIEFQESTQFQLYPNPAHNKITIQKNGSFSGNLSISLYDQSGRSLGIVYTGKSAIGKSQIDIDIHSLASGMYFLNISFGGRIEQLSFVKQ